MNFGVYDAYKTLTVFFVVAYCMDFIWQNMHHDTAVASTHQKTWSRVKI